MSDSSVNTCEVCGTSKLLRFCRDCATLSCNSCLETSVEYIYSCPNCTAEPNSEVCGSCGSTTKIDQERTISICPSCSSHRVEDPEVLLDNLPSNYYETITKVEVVNSEFIDLYRSFDFMVALVRFCRLAGLYGLPQMEMQLEKCSNAMVNINNNAIEGLSKIRKEGMYDIRQHDYFKKISLEHYRSLEGVLRHTEEKIEAHLKQIRHWVDEVKQRLEELTPTALFLREHYETLSTINRYLPTGVNDVAAIVPPIAMSINTPKRKENDECYIVFTQEYCVFLPKHALNDEEIVTGVKIPYANFIQRKRTNSLLKGVQLKIVLKQGNIVISAPPQVLDKVEEYFGLIDSDEPYMVGSPKKIIAIESDTPDKNEYKRAATKMINIFREWLFDDRVQKAHQEQKLELPSMKELKTQLDRLEKMYSNYNYQARHHQIPLDKYQEGTAEIKDNYASLRDKWSKLSGHFGDLDPSFFGK